jgi:uncharacterized protein (UPF0303 family)
LDEYLSELLSEVQKQEDDIIFDSFTSEDALYIGNQLARVAKLQNKKIAINITVNRRQLFHFSHDGASPDNDSWLQRKENIVYRFFKSSYHLSLLMRNKKENFFQKYGVSEHEFAAAGGSFPVTIRGAGVIGAITVSGLSQEEDHGLVVNVIQEYLDNRNR